VNELIRLPPARSLPDVRVAELRAELVTTITSESVSGGSHRHRWVWASGAVAAAAAAIVVISSLVAPHPAYASWTATPDRLGAAETNTLAKQCVHRVQDRFPNASPRLGPVLGERRGDFKTVLVADQDQVSICADWLGRRTGDTQRGSTLEGLTTGAQLSKGQALSLIAVPGQRTGPGAVRMAYGLVGSTVSDVIVRTTDGREVKASLDQGYFLAWWPSGSEVSTIVAQDRTGHTVGRVNR